MRRTSAFAVLMLIWLMAAPDLQAQDEEPLPWWGRGVTFWSRRTPDGCWVCDPAIDIQAAYLRTDLPGEDESDFAIALHGQSGLGIRRLQLASNLEWIPKRGATPDFDLTLQVAPISQLSRFYLSVGAGVITGRDNQGRDRLTGWAEATVALRSWVHDIAPYVRVGRPLQDGGRLELRLGLAHPLFPYRLSHHH